MNSEKNLSRFHYLTSLCFIAAIIGLVAMTSIMARCTTTVNTIQNEIAECVRQGGEWRASTDLQMGGTCEQQQKAK